MGALPPGALPDLELGHMTQTHPWGLTDRPHFLGPSGLRWMAAWALGKDLYYLLTVLLPGPSWQAFEASLNVSVGLKVLAGPGPL